MIVIYNRNSFKIQATEDQKKICQIFQRIAQKVAKSKIGGNIYHKAQFGSLKHLHQTTFETLQYLQQTTFETAYLGKKVINLPKQKVAQKVTIFWGYFILSKNHNEPPKVAQLAKNCSIWSPCVWAQQVSMLHYTRQERLAR